MNPTLTYTGQLVVEICWCGMRHAIPDELSRQAAEHGTTVFCPLGHRWVVAKPRVKELEEQIAEERRRSRAARDLLAAEERSHAATRGHLTRTKKRVGNGVCPCCNRSFTHLQRHMQSKHPDYKNAG